MAISTPNGFWMGYQPIDVDGHYLAGFNYWRSAAFENRAQAISWLENNLSRPPNYKSPREGYGALPKKPESLKERGN